MSARARSATDPVPPRGMTWGELDDAIRAHYGCDPHEREDMRRATLADPAGWKITALLLYEEMQQGRAGPSAAG